MGTWFARLGAIIVLIGAAFAFKYGVDRGIIGPELRVLAGILAGLGFLSLGEYARRRDWPSFAQAVSAGGIGLLSLSPLAGHRLYDLIGPIETFSVLVIVSAAAAAVALRHDSGALAILATIGAFLNPYMIGIPAVGGTAVLLYVLAVDLSVLALAKVRRWPALDWLAFIATWITVGVMTPSMSRMSGIVVAAAFFFVFTIRTFIRAIQNEMTSPRDVAMAVANAGAFLVAGLAHVAESQAGTFTLVLAAIHLGIAFVAAYWLEENLALQLTAFGLAAALVALAAPLQLQGHFVAAWWAAQSAVLVSIGRAVEERSLRAGGALLLLGSLQASLVEEFELGAAYSPERLLFSGESLTLAIQVVALYVAAWAFKADQGEDWEHGAATTAILGANLLTVVWFSLEATAAFHRLAPENEQGLLFALSAIWGIYGIAVVAVGVALRRWEARLFGVALLGVTVGKLALVDLWRLELSYRTVAFVGLGLVLLLCSLMYQRFRDLIVDGSVR